MFPDDPDKNIQEISPSKSEVKMPSNTENVKQKIDQNYLKNRDPIKEFFALTCQSVKLSSPHLNLIAHINTDMLYQKALKDAIPYFKYWNWIEATIQKEVLTQLMAKKPGKKLPDDLIIGDSKQKSLNEKRRKTLQKNQLKKSMKGILNRTGK